MAAALTPMLNTTTATAATATTTTATATTTAATSAHSRRLRLFASVETVACFSAGCVSCAYKLVVEPSLASAPGANYYPNQRPEQCLRERWRAVAASGGKYPVSSSAFVGCGVYAGHSVASAHELGRGTIYGQSAPVDDGRNAGDGGAAAAAAARGGDVGGGSDAALSKKARKKKRKRERQEAASCRGASGSGARAGGLRVLTIGDGDLSFSLSLIRAMAQSKSGMGLVGSALVATTHLSRAELDAAYGADRMSQVGDEDYAATPSHCDTTNPPSHHPTNLYPTNPTPPIPPIPPTPPTSLPLGPPI